MNEYNIVVCQDCLKVTEFTDARHNGEERCSCGGDFCGCEFCVEDVPPFLAIVQDVQSFLTHSPEEDTSCN